MESGVVCYCTPPRLTRYVLLNWLDCHDVKSIGIRHFTKIVSHLALHARLLHRLRQCHALSAAGARTKFVEKSASLCLVLAEDWHVREVPTFSCHFWRIYSSVRKLRTILVTLASTPVIDLVSLRLEKKNPHTTKNCTYHFAIAAMT